MLRIGVLSDTHLRDTGHGMAFLHDLAIDYFSGIDLLLHAGDVGDPSILEVFTDIPVYAVRGNTDSADSRLPSKRIVTVEDAAELQLHQQHVVRLETRPPNVEGKGAVRQRQLVINCLRMRPDRIIVGEVRGEAALDMLQAMNTGHDGSLTTIHANTPCDALSRLETMVAMANLNIPESAIKRQIASAIDVVVQVSRLSDGKRRVTSLSEVTGMEGEVVTMQDIFVYKKMGIGENGEVLGQFVPTGIRPKFAERLVTSGIHLPAEMFEATPVAGIR